MINPIVIPLGNGSLLDNIELRYSLRAIDKFASGYTDIVIVGKLPYFVRGVMCIPLEDSFVGMKRREGNICHSPTDLCHSPQILAILGIIVNNVCKYQM
jgi:hypothetical protein